MPRAIAIMDTGSGNLHSVEKALVHVGGAPVITGDPRRIARADAVVVPGQGAFGAFVAAARARGLDQALREVIAAGRPMLGICLGLQILYEDSQEQGPVPGLGLLAGHVVRFRPRDPAHKVPHMGWNQVWRRPRAADDSDGAAIVGEGGDAAADTAADPLLRGIPDGAHFYFVHSYHVRESDSSTVALTCDYGGHFTAAVRRDNLFACQFHPEKSQRVGLRLLANFVEST